MDRRHTDREYEGELETLRERVLMMGARVEEMLGHAMHAYRVRDVAEAQASIDLDRTIDQLEIEIDQMSLQILARRQPVASDLRFITTILKLVTDLERMGDLGVNICERVVELGSEPRPNGNDPIQRMADPALAMIHDALDAFVAGDSHKAEQVIERDRVVDAYYAQLFPELVTGMMTNPTVVHSSTRLLSIGKYLERLADHATNIAEMVVFMVKGQDVRHSGPSHAPSS